ncbi:MAG: FAD-binding oxidoreductase [Xanthomonadales bacterium]|jgi:FAD/FMN-containing dehydrogenase|nr:FAD-binding oxidoreductase [Xanthomonadales bacterium]
MKRRRFLSQSIAATVAATLPARALWAESLRHTPTEVSGNINAVTGNGKQVTLARAAVQEFSDSLKGKLLLPGIEGYDEARLLINPDFDKHPALVVQPTGPADVSSAVTFARENELLLAVKCGGHSASGQSSCDGGMQIDLSAMRGVRVDPSARTARVEGGSLLGELDHETMAHGLVTTAGTVSHTGVGGLTLGGGFGRVGRRFGLTLDNALEFDVVTADGRLRRASMEENPDLFWGLRGGGGNFGIVTSFLFRLHPMQRTVGSGRFIFPFSEAKQVMNFFAEYADSAPDELQVDGGIGGPPGQEPGVIIMVVWSGDPARTEEVFAPIRKAGTVVSETVTPMDYVALQRSGDYDDPRAFSGYMKSGFTGALSPALIDDLVDNFEASPSRATRVVFQQSGGAIGRVAADATAFAHRESKHNMLSFVSWKYGEDGSDHVRYIKSHWANMEKYTRGFYTNDMFGEGQEVVNANYRGNFSRLVEIKKAYDPGNLFRLNANVKPLA